jgi:hypothetical protein
MKSLYEELGGTYHQEGDYLIPDLAPPSSPHIGIWGFRRKNYLLKNREVIYTAMLLSGKLNAHLEDIDLQAEEMLYRLINQMARAEGVTEQLKANDQMAWVGAINNIRARAEEVVYADLIAS